ncbi:MAG: hypothetical protein KJZ78_09305, partial [Bryobacteraceae bacterium]|nr:hypothetical protein [Bryobacteraceae bacterium]
GEGGDKFAYRLNVRPPRPDFRLRATPENPNIPRGGYVPLTVTAFRMDGFDGPVEISVQELPEGVSATKAVIASGQDSATLLLSATGQAKLDRALPLKIIGEAKIEGRREIATRFSDAPTGRRDDGRNAGSCRRGRRDRGDCCQHPQAE